MDSKKSIGEQLYPILNDMESALWEYEASNNAPPFFPKEALRCATKIFMAALMEQVYHLQREEGMNIEDVSNMAQKLGEDLRSLIKTYANVDTMEFYKV